MKWVHDATESKLIWPHKFLENTLRLKVGLYFDGETLPWRNQNNWVPGARGDDDAHTTFCLYDESREWDKLKVTCALSVTDAEGFRASILPSDEGGNIGFAIQALCKTTRWQEIKVCSADSSTVEIEIPKDKVFGEVKILPWAYRLNDSKVGSDGFAKKRGAILADGYSTSIYVDEVPGVPGRGVDIQWQDFPESEDALYYLEIDDDIPHIIFNSRSGQLKDIIDNQDKRTSTARTRDALFSIIAGDLWLQMAQTAAQVRADGDGDSEYPQMKFAEGVFNTLRKRASIGEDELAAVGVDTNSRGAVAKKIQHWLKTIPNQQRFIEKVLDSGGAQ